MQMSKTTKRVQLAAPQSIEATAATVVAADVAGFGEALFVLSVGALTNTKTLDAKLQECATVDGQYADIANAALVQIVGGAAAKNALYAIQVKLGPSRKRYIKPVITAGTGATALVAAELVLADGQQLPLTATEAGLAQRVEV